MSAKKKKDGAAEEFLEEKVADMVNDEPVLPEGPSEGELAARVTELESELREQCDRFLRMAAEYDNYRKRTAKERDASYECATADALTAFLPVYDNLERAICQPCADEEYKKGVELIMKQFVDLFEKYGVCETPGAGQPFDPEVHDAVMHENDESLPENVVAEVFQKGFVMKDRVLRPAMVRVAN